jgi:hypothetical protein
MKKHMILLRTNAMVVKISDEYKLRTPPTRNFRTGLNTTLEEEQQLHRLPIRTQCAHLPSINLSLVKKMDASEVPRSRADSSRGSKQEDEYQETVSASPTTVCNFSSYLNLLHRLQ